MPIVDAHYKFEESDWPERKFLFLGEPSDLNWLTYLIECRKWADEHGQRDGQDDTTKSYTLLEKLPFFIEKWREGLEIWNPAIVSHNLKEEWTKDKAFEETWKLLINCCEIANIDYKEFVEKTNKPEINGKVRAGWNIVARLRLICDVAIILWTRVSNCTVPCTGNPDSIGTFFSTGCADILKLSDGAKDFLKILNEFANFYKHPKFPSDVTIVGKFDAYLRKKDGQEIAQPVADLVAGTNRFLAAIFNAILPPKPGV